MKKNFFIELLGRILYVEKFFNMKIKKKKDAEKNWNQYMLMCRWIGLKQRNVNIADFLIESGYKRIAVYGMNHIGTLIVEELNNSQVEVAYGIDKNAHDISNEIAVWKVENNLPYVDAIIVTAMSEFKEIEADLSKKIKCDIISIDKVI